MNESITPDEAARAILNLPPNWWQSARAASTLLQWFRRHVVPLLVAGEVNENIQHNVYAGLLLDHGETLVWLTAGHVVDELRTILASPTFKLSAIAWLDEFDAKNAENVRLHRTDIPMNSWRAAGLDVGVILPSELDTGNIRKNNGVSPVNSVIWENLKQAKPEGYYAIGFPRPWSKHEQKLLSNKQILHTINADLICLPLEEVSPPVEFSEDPKWSNKEAFYGKILPFTDDPTFEMDDLKGLSGGPILSVERDSRGRIGYRLVGIIDSWAPAQSIIRAEPINQISVAVEKWLDEREA